jgi:MFS family permease
VWKSTRELLARNPEFRLLFLATVISLIGDWFSFVAVADLVSELTGRPGTAAYIYAASVLPTFLASPLAGVIVDRYDRRKTLIWSNVVRVPLALLLAVAAWQDSVAAAAIGVIGLGLGAAFFDPGSNAATPNLVAPRDLAAAQVLMGLAWASMLVVGAGLGGVVADVLGRYTAFAIDALSFVVSAALVAAIHKPMQEAQEGAGEAAPRGGGVAEAWRYLRRDHAVHSLVFAKVGVSSANGLVGLLPAFGRATSASGVATGLLFAMRGLGALIGPLLARSLMTKLPAPHDTASGAPRPRDPVLRALLLVCGLSTLSYAAFYALLPLVPWFGAMLLLVGCAHLGGGTQWTASTYGLQALTPDRLRGRVLSLDYGLATLAIGVSSVAAGVLADRYGLQTAVSILTGLAALYGGFWLAWTRPLWRR